MFKGRKRIGDFYSKNNLIYIRMRVGVRQQSKWTEGLDAKKPLQFNNC